MTNNIPRIRPKLIASRGPSIDMDQCVANVGGNRFNLVLVAAARTREIRRQHRESDLRAHTFPILTALAEVQSGTVDARTYLNRVK